MLASAKMARSITGTVAEVQVPDHLVSALERDRDAGVAFALEMVDELRERGGIEGVHLVPVTRIVQVAERLRAGR